MFDQPINFDIMINCDFFDLIVWESLMVWAWNLICGRFINFQKGRKILTWLTFGCPNYNKKNKVHTNLEYKWILTRIPSLHQYYSIETIKNIIFCSTYGQYVEFLTGAFWCHLTSPLALITNEDNPHNSFYRG